MRFPSGLRVRLAQRRFLRAFGGSTPSPIFHFSRLAKHFPADAHIENLDSEGEWHSAGACAQAAKQAGAPVVWLGGTEPLFHPAIGEVTAALAGQGHYVFLHTSGVGLRKRIHEFKPLNRLYLTFEIPVGNASSSGLSAASDQVSFTTVSEGIRVARLAGFYVSAHVTVSETTSGADVAACMEALQALRVDGVVASSGGTFSVPAPAAGATNAVREVTQLIPSAGWRDFSRLLQASYEQTVAAIPQSESANRQRQSADACEETA